MWLTTLSAFAFLTYYIVESLGLLASPYSGLFGFVAVPALFLVGLLLVPIGIVREARRRRRGMPAWQWPALDFGRSRTRQALFAVAVLTMVNLAIVAIAGFGAVHYMETDRFCGQVCHEPMRPEFTAHQQAPHARVECVQCHVSPGAAGMVRAKLNGTRQAYEMLTGAFPRPIPSSPARGIPVAADTCAQCHTPGYPERDITRIVKEYANDEPSSETTTTVLLYTAKNHWHARPDRRVEYASNDAKRGTIPYIKMTEANGRVTEYFAGDLATAPTSALRQMDCLDCHSRPAHRFIASAEQAVDEAIGAGHVVRSLPFVRREMVKALKATYATEPAAVDGIRRHFIDFYKAADTPKTGEVDRVVQHAIRLYRANIFPEMKIGWGTYVSQIGHSEADGCFRCHDDEHKSRDGRVVKQDCELCHKQD